MGKGSSGTNTVTNNSQPPQAVLDQYTNLIGQANNVAANPLNQYGGSMVAGFTPDQLSAFNTVNNTQGISQPYINQAQTMLQNSTQPLWNGVQQWSPDAIQQYMNPYQQDVTNATMANINETNAQQQQQVVGNAISSGAWGGDRSAIAQSELARQQALASNQTLAGLNANNYSQATAQFNQQQGAQLGANATTASLNSQGAFGEANLGNQAQSNALQGAAAQLATGQQQQTLAQSALNIPYEQFLQQQAYPYQDLSWLSGISTGLGSGMGGSGSTTSPGPNTASQALGTASSLGTLGYLGYLAFSDRRLKDHIKRIGNFKDYPLYKFNYKGDDRQNIGVMAQDVEKKNPGAVHEIDGYKAVDYSKLARGGAAGFARPHYDGGGSIPNIDLSYIPGVSMTKGMGAPRAPEAYKAPQQSNGSSNAVGLMAQLGKMGGGGENPLGLSSGAGFTADDLNKIGADFDKYGGGFGPATFSVAGMARGGMADGGIPDDVMNAQNAIDVFDPPMDDGSDAPAGIAPPAPPPPFGGNGISPQDKYGSVPKFDGAGSAPINKVDPVLSLLAAGSAIGAGTSPYFGVNAGAGAQVGIKNLQEQKEQAAKESNEQGTLKQRGEQLFDQANEWRNKLFEETQHNEQSLDETSRHNRVVEGQGKFSMSPYGQVLNTRTGEVTGQPLGGTPPPMGPDGKPMTGPDLSNYLQQSDPDRALRAQMLVDGDKKVPSLTSRSDPTWKQAILDARMIDPTFNEERYANKQKFQADNKGQMDTFNTIPSHLKVLEDAAHALDNGDSRAFNTVRNAWEKQFGSALPTNMDTAKNMVSAEIVKAITGAGGVTDRQEAQAQFSNASSDGQLTGAVNMTKHLISERINSAAYRYQQTVGGDYYHYLRPEVRSYLGVGTPDATATAGAPAAAPAAPAVTAAAIPALGDRISGKTTATVKGKPVVWNGTGWDPVGWKP